MTEGDLHHTEEQYEHAEGDEDELEDEGEELENGDYEEGEDYEQEFQVGDEIELTHEELWDDSSLIEAWDAAVKQYEVYHSKNGGTTPSPTSNVVPATNSKKNKAESTHSTTVPSKRFKQEQTTAESSVSNGIPSLTPADQETQSLSDESLNLTPASDYSVTGRKPSFKKADKAGFKHLKEEQQQARNKAQKAKAERASVAAKNIASTGSTFKQQQQQQSIATASQPPAMDEATILYYQQLGYYYDPAYAAAETESVSITTPETPAVPAQAAPSATTRASNRPFVAAPASHPMQAAHPSGHYATYPGYPSAIPFHPRGPGAGPSPGQMAFGSGPMPMHMPMQMPMPMPGAYSAARPLMMPPMPPMPMPATGGPDSNEALSNLIMAWYFSGYYTGLYQAQRR